MRILVYKRTHVGDTDGNRRFGNEGCMGRIRGFTFDAVIGVGGISGLPTRQGIAAKINWVGRRPQKLTNPIDSRGPLVSFRPKDFRLFEQQGPLLANEAPLLARRVFGSRARFFFDSLSRAEQQEAENLLKRILDLCEFDELQLDNSDGGWGAGACNSSPRKGRCMRLRMPVTPSPSVNQTSVRSREGRLH
jgi:hypothetical protein